jgi:Tat protein translocase TatB subunit
MARPVMRRRRHAARRARWHGPARATDKTTIDVEARTKVLMAPDVRDNGVIDLGISKVALIGAVALIVIGPEKLPRVARTVGTMLGKAQRYVSDVKAEVNRSMELDELKKMKETVESAARDVEHSTPDRGQ